MKFYYQNNGQDFGPLETSVYRQLKSAGIISDQTLVRLSTQTEWMPSRAFEDQMQSESARLGMSILSGITDKVSQATGLEGFQGFSMKTLFSEVFKRHSPEEMEEKMEFGTPRTTPDFADVPAAWPTPWLFVRLLGISLLLSFSFYFALLQYENAFLIPGWLFSGAFGIPVAVMYFFVEINVLRNISLHRILFLLIRGGFIGIVLSLALFEQTQLHEWIGAMSAGVIEEVGKLAAAIYLTRKWKGTHWILNGLLIGAAVGAGFGAFETAGYVYVYFFDGAEGVMLMRGALAPFTHVLWTAIATAAFWKVKGTRPFEFDMLKDIKFLRIMIFVMALHALWNSPLFGENLMTYLITRTGLGVLGWIVALLLVQEGLKEIRTVQNELASADA